MISSHPTLEQQCLTPLEGLSREALVATISELRATLLLSESQRNWLRGAVEGATETATQYQEIAEARLKTIGLLRQECTDLERERNRIREDLEERRAAVQTLLDGSEEDSVRYGKLAGRLTSLAYNQAQRAILLDEVIEEMQEAFKVSPKMMEDRGWLIF